MISKSPSTAGRCIPKWREPRAEGGDPGLGELLKGLGVRSKSESNVSSASFGGGHRAAGIYQGKCATNLQENSGGCGNPFPPTVFASCAKTDHPIQPLCMRGQDAQSSGSVPREYGREPTGMKPPGCAAWLQAELTD